MLGFGRYVAPFAVGVLYPVSDDEFSAVYQPVSYTHLTLPTIYSV